jgi:hypothetical protein
VRCYAPPLDLHGAYHGRKGAKVKKTCFCTMVSRVGFCATEKFFKINTQGGGT